MHEALVAVRDYLLTAVAAGAVLLAGEAVVALFALAKAQVQRIKDERIRQVAEAVILWVEAHGKNWTSEQKLVSAIARAAEKYRVHLSEDDIEAHLARLRAEGKVHALKAA